MRIVVDTNVFVSAVIKANSLPFIVARWIDRNGGLLTSAATEQELWHVLQRPYIAALMVPTFRDDLARLLA
jgi:predicted nucleic acid-binding protein